MLRWWDLPAPYMALHGTKNFSIVTCGTLQRIPDKVSTLEKSHQGVVTVRLTPVLFAVSYSLRDQARSSLSFSVFTPVWRLLTGKGLTEGEAGAVIYRLIFPQTPLDGTLECGPCLSHCRRAWVWRKRLIANHGLIRSRWHVRHTETLVRNQVLVSFSQQQKIDHPAS